MALGSGLPVLFFALAIAWGGTSLSRWFSRLTQVEYYMRRITGVVLILVGFYYDNLYVLKIGG